MTKTFHFLCRYCSKPSEFILESLPHQLCEFSIFIRNLVQSKISFLADHRFDLSEIYSEEFDEELKAIPDPKEEPLKHLNEFLTILNEFGLWSADRAALLLIMQIEKAKVKTPYERHYLLLCMVSTTLIQVRAHCDSVFQSLADEKERIQTYSSPKVLRLLEVLKSFKPSEEKRSAEISKIGQKLEKDLDEIDFVKASTEIESTAQKIQHSGEEFKHVVSALQEMVKEPPIMNGIATNSSIESNIISKSSPSSHRFRGTKGRKPPFRRNPRTYHNPHANDPDSLCGLIFCESKLTAKVLFSLFYETSRSDPDLKFLMVQYTVDRVADPLTESKQAENEHRRQEEVLKRFRMHSCNLLIGTSVLEEGIELPKCNLVVRWDPPKTYRSYVQCKGRARSQNACHIIMIPPPKIIKEIAIPINESIDFNHKFICNEESNCIFEIFDEQTNGIAENDGSVEQKSTELMKLETNNMIERLAQYMHIEKILLNKCSNQEPSSDELFEADSFTKLIKPYQPLPDGASVDLSSAVVLVNKYCAKLPSDTFTKLTALWRCMRTVRNEKEYFQYTLRLPINSPVKQDILVNI